jgi:hypothetical protein
MSAIIISASVGAATGIVSAVVSGNQGAKSIRINAAIQQQQLAQQKSLDEAILRANNSNTKLKLLADTIVNIRTSKENAVRQARIVNEQSAKDTEKKNLIILGVGGGIILVGAIAVIKLA